MNDVRPLLDNTLAQQWPCITTAQQWSAWYGVHNTFRLPVCSKDYTSPMLLDHICLNFKLKLPHYTPRRRLGGGRSYSSYSRWGWVVRVTPRPRFTPGERTPGTHCTGGCVGPRAGLDTEVRGKFLFLCWGSNLDRPVVQPVVRHYTEWVTRLTIISFLSRYTFWSVFWYRL
jgi:hypothetical protein